jgi:hypothetical protein
MSTTITSTIPTTGSSRTTHPLRLATLVVGVVAAAVTTAFAAIVDAAGVPLAVDGEAIPLGGFAQMTFLGAVLGGLLAAALNRYNSRPRHRFMVTTAALTVASCVPSVALPPDTATKLALVASHLIAAAIVIPVVARRTYA